MSAPASRTAWVGTGTSASPSTSRWPLRSYGGNRPARGGAGGGPVAGRVAVALIGGDRAGGGGGGAQRLQEGPGGKGGGGGLGRVAVNPDRRLEGVAEGAPAAACWSTLVSVSRPPAPPR